MNPILDALERYGADTRPELKSTVVPEISGEDGEPLEIFARELTVDKFTKVQEQCANAKSDMEKCLVTAWLCFLNADGSRVFRTLKQVKTAFAKCEPDMVARILNELDLTEKPDEDELIEAHEKKSPRIQAAGS